MQPEESTKNVSPLMISILDLCAFAVRLLDGHVCDVGCWFW